MKTIISLDASDTVSGGVASSSGGVTVRQMDTATGEIVPDATGWVEGLEPAAFVVDRLLKRASFQAAMTGYEGVSASEVAITVDAEFTATSRLIHDPSVFVLRDPALLGLVRANFAGRFATVVANVTVDGKTFAAPLHDAMISEVTGAELWLRP